MIEELNQYMLPSTLMKCFDAWREDAYKQAIRSIPKSSLGWFLDMLASSARRWQKEDPTWQR